MKVSGAPPALFISDHQCYSCEHQWEETLGSVEDHQPTIDVGSGQLIGRCCPNCGRFNTRPTDGTVAAPKLVVRGNHDFADRQAKRLYERSNEHYKREGKDEAIERQRDVFRREGMTSDDKVAEAT